MMGITFQRHKKTNLYLSNQDNSSKNGNVLGYYIPQGEEQDVITFHEAWTNFTGYFVFAGIELTTNQLLDELHGYTPSLDMRFMVWLQKKLDGRTIQKVLQIDLYTIEFEQLTVINALTPINLGNYQLDLTRSMPVLPAADGQRLNWDQLDQTTEFLLVPRQSPVANSHTLTIPLTGDLLGCFTGTGMIHDFSDDPDAGWEAGFRYFFKRPDGNKNQIASQFYPLFDLQSTIGTYAMFDVQWDINHILCPDRTFLQFQGRNAVINMETDPPSISLSDDGGTIPSWLRTRVGQAFMLTPKEQSGQMPKLVFQRKSQQQEPLALYLVPDGTFSISIPAAKSSDPECYILGGLSGTEYIGIAPAGTLITFSSNRPAYAKVFPLSSGNPNGSDNILSGCYNTAWVNFENPDQTPAYYVQPGTNPLFGPCPSNNERLLCYKQLLAGQLGSQPFPLAPYAGLTPSNTLPYLLTKNEKGQDAPTHTLEDFEFQVLNPERRQQILVVNNQQPSTPKEDQLESSATGVSPKPTTLITPQGLLATMKSTSSWLSLLLSINGKQKLAFNDLDQKVVRAFQVNQQFLVVSTRDALTQGKASFANKISIDQWPFTFNLPLANDITTGQYTNVMIFKFCQGSLMDHAKAPATWTDASLFNQTKNQGIQALSVWLVQYLQDGVNNYEQGDQDFAQFAGLVNDPNWRGILGLNLDISIQNFPQQLQGLLAGINFSTFRAHHFGIQVNRPKIKGSQIQLEDNSAMFALINYNASTHWNQARASNSAFGFRVLKLKVVFQNSRIQNFTGQAQLTINQLFGSQVSSTLTDGAFTPSNSLVFNSGFEDHDGKPVYTFTTQGNTRFYLNNDVLQYVEVTKSSFYTLIPKSKEKGQVQSRFSVWGYLNFSQLKKDSKPQPVFTDLFSYGPSGENETVNSPSGLSFSNFWIDMDFPLQTPAEVSFKPEIQAMTFDTGQSTPRPGSLVSKLAIQPVSMLYGADLSALGSQGFIPVSAELGGPQLQIPPNSWFGLMLDLNLGSMGDLVGQSSFKARLVLAWGTEPGQGNRYPVLVGMALPGANSQGQFFNLQGVLTLTLSQIRLIYNREQEAYLISFSDLALKFLGISLPPGSQMNALIFGDPSGATREMGWYVGYNKN